jgi:hypothetical protein
MLLEQRDCALERRERSNLPRRVQRSGWGGAARGRRALELRAGQIAHDGQPGDQRQEAHGKPHLGNVGRSWNALDTS